MIGKVPDKGKGPGEKSFLGNDDKEYLGVFRLQSRFSFAAFPFHFVAVTVMNSCCSLAKMICHCIYKINNRDSLLFGVHILFCIDHFSSPDEE